MTTTPHPQTIAFAELSELMRQASARATHAAILAEASWRGVKIFPSETVRPGEFVLIVHPDDYQAMKDIGSG